MAPAIRPAAEPPPPEPEDGLRLARRHRPRPTRAHGKGKSVANKALYTLHCALGKDGFRSFQYAHLDSDSEFRIEPGGHVLTLRFAGFRTTKVTIRGRNLWQLYDYLHQHRIPWIMRADRDFPDGAGKQPLISTIEFAEVNGGGRDAKAIEVAAVQACSS